MVSRTVKTTRVSFQGQRHERVDCLELFRVHESPRGNVSYESRVTNVRHLPKKYSVTTSGFIIVLSRSLSFLLNRSHPTANGSRDSLVRNEFARFSVRIPHCSASCTRQKSVFQNSFFLCGGRIVNFCKLRNFS